MDGGRASRLGISMVTADWIWPSGTGVATRAMSFTQAANQAGISRRYGGIHFEVGDLTGRATGRLLADQVWAKAVSLWNGKKADDER